MNINEKKKRKKKSSAKAPYVLHTRIPNQKQVVSKEIELIRH